MNDFSKDIIDFSDAGMKTLLKLVGEDPVPSPEFSVSALSLVPFNPLTGKPYTGRNSSRLWLESRKIHREDLLRGKHIIDPRYMTFEQTKEFAKTHGPCGINKGATAVHIIIPGTVSLRITKEEAIQAKAAHAKGQPARILRSGKSLKIFPKHIVQRKSVADGGENWSVLSGYQATPVFCCRDMWGIPPLNQPLSKSPESFSRKLCEGLGINLVESTEINDCVYIPEQKTIFVPDHSRFFESGGFERSAFHEFYHASADILKRDSLNPNRHAQEEAEAELFSLFLGDALGIPGDEKRKNSVRYIKNWSTFSGKKAGAMIWECMGNVIQAMTLSGKIIADKEIIFQNICTEEGLSLFQE